MLRLLIQISCMSKQYSDGKQCQPCPYQCNTCIELTCTSCSALTYRQMPNCQCQEGYGDVPWQSSCVQCALNCKSCTATECLECFGGLSVYRGVCVCSRGFYGFPCTLCLPGCLECDAVKCNTCQVGAILNGLQCQCVDGYYSDNNGLCVSCGKECLTCNQAGCLTCKQFRDISRNCQCQSGFFEKFGQCYRCKPNCQTCTSPLSCSTCLATESVLVNGNCNCDSGYQIAASGNYVEPYTCQQCQIGCRRCPQARCTEVYPGFIIINGVAQCAIGYYISNNQCLECSISTTNSGINQYSCPACRKGYYLSQSSVCTACIAQNCVTCDQYQCQTCQSGYQLFQAGCILCSDFHCSGCNVSSVCTSCMNNYSYDSATKTCVPITTPDCLKATDQVCSECASNTYLYHPSHTCPSLPTNCLSGSQSSVSVCSVCNDNYYELQGVCYANPTNCKNFNNNTMVCTLCHDNYILDNTNPPVCLLKTQYCINMKCTSGGNCQTCNNGYVNVNGDCYLCSASCGGVVDACATCTKSYQLQSCTACHSSCLTCSSGYCGCATNYYLNSHQCYICPPSCLTCTSSISCQTCVQNASGPLCKCWNGYYFDVDQCKNCMVNCLICSIENICTTCKPGYRGNTCQYQMLNYYEPTQICNPGYCQPILNQACQPCHYTCQTCSITPYNCQLCALNRVWPCQNCANGFFGEYCVPCPVNCATCNINGCLTCNIGYLTPPQCYCLSNYYASGLTCLQCEGLCQECQFGPLICTQCKLDRIRPPLCICPDGYYQIDETSNCGQCSSHCTTCVTSPTNCLKCPFNRQYDPVCSCAQGYFGSDCLPCPYYCKACTIAGCTQCGKFRNKDCQCLDGYYEAMQQDCQSCHSDCVTCMGSNRYNCTSCSPARQLSGGQCICEKNYYLDNGSCLQCTSDIIVCYPQVCGDGILQSPEVCDDGNLLSRDGCSNCLHDQHYYYCNQPSLFQPTICIRCPLNCMTCNQYECLGCESHYYYKNGLCLQCDIHCGECVGPLQSDCQTCAQGEHGFQVKCDFCSQHNQQLKNGVCVPICGDGIIYNEECDDGNTIDGDGCSSTCIIEDDWVCSNIPSVCIQNIYPTATLIVQGTQYTQNRQFLLQFSKPMVIVADYANYLKMQINSVPIDSTKIIHYDDSNTVTSCLFTIELIQSVPMTQAVVIFPSEQIYDLIQGLPLTQYSVSTDVQYYEVPTSIAQSTESISSVLSQSMLYSLGGLTLFGLSTGSLDFLWNMLDTLQQLQYLSQLNIPFPAILTNYLNVFSIFSLQTVTPKYNITLVNEWQNQQQINNVLGGSPYFLMNIQCVIFTLLQVVGIYLAFNTIFAISSLFLNKRLGLKIAKISAKQIGQFRTILNRVYMTAYYDLNYAIFVTFYYFMKGYESPYLIVEQGLAAGFLLATLGITIAQSSALNLSKSQRKHTDYKLRYGDLLQTRSPYWAILYQVRKQLFMMALIMMHDHPLLQIPLMLSINLVFLIQGRIFTTVENMKILFTEITQLLSLSFMLAYSLSTNDLVSPQSCSLLAMVQIGLYSFLLSFGIITDTIQKLKPALRKLIERILPNRVQ